MSEEKLYAVKNDEGQYWEFGKEPNGFFDFSIVDLPITFGKHLASEVAKKSGGHVVTLVEEPEKVLLSKEQAKIVEEARIVKDAHGYTRPAKYITENAEDSYASERILMEAFVNDTPWQRRRSIWSTKCLTGSRSMSILLKHTDLQFIPGPYHGFLLMKSKVDHGLSSPNQRLSNTDCKNAKKKR